MGWNDHMEVRDMVCLDCGAASAWEFWDDVGKARYSGSIGEKLGVRSRVERSGRCPHCGSTRGEDDEDAGDPRDEW